MSVQLIITAVMTLLPYLNEGMRISILKNPGVAIIAAFSGLILSCMLFCIQSLAKRVPTNYILMFDYTICEAYTVTFIAATVGDGLIVI